MYTDIFTSFYVGFYPCTYFGNDTLSHTAWDVIMSQSPFGVLLNGNFWVCIFCVLSGLVISLGVFRKNDNIDYVSKAMLKRYFRLSIPIFAVSLIIFLMLKLNLISNIQTAEITGSTWLASFYHEQFSLKDIVIHSFVRVWLESDGNICTAFWMLTYVFYGSFLSFILSIIGLKKKKRILFIYIWFAFMYLYLNSLLACYAIGTAMAYIYANVQIERKKYKLYVGALFIVVGNLFGGYLSYVIPINKYDLLNHLPAQISVSNFYHVIGAALLILGIWLYVPVSKFMNCKICKFLGKISFAIYIIHIPVLFSVGTGVFQALYKINHRYNVDSLLTLIVMMVSLVVLAYVFSMLVEKPCDKLVNKIVCFMGEKDEV